MPLCSECAGCFVGCVFERLDGAQDSFSRIRADVRALIDDPRNGLVGHARERCYVFECCDSGALDFAFSKVVDCQVAPYLV